MSVSKRLKRQINRAQAPHVFARQAKGAIARADQEFAGVDAIHPSASPPTAAYCPTWGSSELRAYGTCNDRFHDDAFYEQDLIAQAQVRSRTNSGRFA